MLAYSFTTEDEGLVLRRYWTNACQNCAIKHSCTTGKERLISRWEHEHILEAVQRRLDEQPLRATAALPAGVRGPVLFLALRRFAAGCVLQLVTYSALSSTTLTSAAAMRASASTCIRLKALCLRTTIAIHVCRSQKAAAGDHTSPAPAPPARGTHCAPARRGPLYG
jgi:hypothetical protein